MRNISFRKELIKAWDKDMIYQERTATMITLLMRYSLCISVILYRKMKVLLIDVYNYNKGGAETVCFNTGKLLEEHGHQVAEKRED